MRLPGPHATVIRTLEWTARRHRRTVRWRPRRVTIGAAVAALLVTGLGTPAAPAASASESDSSTAVARFLSGALPTSAGTLDDLDTLGGVSASNDGSRIADTQAADLGATALSGADVTLPTGITMPLGAFVALDAANQFARAGDNGRSRAASGAVDDSGIVDTSGTGAFPSSVTIDIRPLLDTSDVPDSTMHAISLTVRGVTGIAALTAGATPAPNCTDPSNPSNCLGYVVAGASLDVSSPIVGAVLDGSTDDVRTVDAAVRDSSNGLRLGAFDGLRNSVDILDDLVPGLDVVDNDLQVTVTSTLADTIASHIDPVWSRDGVTVDLAAGTVTADLGQIIGGLNGRPPDTALLGPGEIADIDTAVTVLFGQISSQFSAFLNAALDAATVTMSGPVCLLEDQDGCTAGVDLSYDGSLADLLDGTATVAVAGTGLLDVAGLDDLVGAVQENLRTGMVTATTFDLITIDRAVDDAIQNLITPPEFVLPARLDNVFHVIRATLNVQQEPTAGAFTEVALRVSMAEDLATTIDLGKASVGPNVDVFEFSADSLQPDHGPAVGGTTVTVTGDGFVAGATGVTFGNAPIAPADVTVTDAHTLSVTSPPHAPGPVHVTVTDGHGLISDRLKYVYDEVPAPTITSPRTGDVIADTTPDIAGTGLDGHLIAVTEAGSPICDTTVIDGAWTCPATLPLLPGKHTVTAVQSDSAGNTSDPSNDVAFTVAAVPSAPLDPEATPGDGYASLSWTAPTDPGGTPILGYNVYLGTAPGEEAATPINAGTLVPGLGMQATGLTNGTTYFFVVTAVNDAGESAASNETSATPSVTACPAPFLDVPSSNPFCVDISWMKAQGISQGYPGDVYRPLLDVPRAQMAAFAFRELNPDLDDPSCTEKPFDDVSTGSPFCGDIAWLKEQGITDGYSDGTFRPAATISRQGIAAFFFRMNNIGSEDPTCAVAPFSDVPVSSIFCGDIAWMKDEGISFGTGDVGNYDPLGLTTRQAMSALVHRMDNSR